MGTTVHTGTGGSSPPALTGTVIDAATAQPIAEARVSFEGGSAPHPDLAQITNDDGGFRYPRVAAGTYLIAVHTPDGRHAVLAVSISDGMNAHATVHIGADAAPDTDTPTDTDTDDGGGGGGGGDTPSEERSRDDR